MNRLLFIILLLFHISMEGAPVRYGRLFSDYGLISGQYTSICQDHDGFVWIGTDRGVLKFDGNSHDLYTYDISKKNSLSDNRVLQLMCDSKGRVWIGTANGLNLYDPATDSFQLIKLSPKLFDGYINALCEQKDGTITFLVAGVGLYIIGYDDGEPTAVRYLINMDDEKEFTSMISTSDGKLWVGTSKGAVYSISKNGSYSRINVSSDYIIDLSLEADGNIIVADLNKLYRINTKDNRVVPLYSLQRIHINRLSNRNRGPVYIATAGEGLWKIDTGGNEVMECTDIYSPFLNLEKSYIGAVSCSDDGDLWLGCNYHGVIMVPGKQLPFLYWRLSDPYFEYGGGIKAMTVWRGNVMIGFDRGKIAMLSPKGEEIMHAVIPGGGTISSFTHDGPEKILVGMANDGVWEITVPSGVVKKVVEISGKYPEIVTAIGNNDEIFIAPQGIGVMRYNRKTGVKTWLKDYLVGKGLTNPYVTSMYRTSDNKIWMGHYGGLECYDLTGDTLVTIDQSPFLKGASFKVTADENGNLLVAASHGLIQIDSKGNEISKLTQEDGLIDNDLRAIAIDKDGGRWISSLRGLSYQHPARKRILAYHGGSGIVEKGFDHIAYSPENNIMFLGSSFGITSFCPDSVKSIGFDVDIKVSAIYLNDKKITLANEFNGSPVIKGPLLSPTSIRLPYKENSLILRLSTMDFRDGSNVKYLWRLIGLSDDWTSTRPGENLIYLPHLDPGNYRLEIKAMENNIASDMRVIVINISSPWYFSTIAKIVYFLLFATMLVMVWFLFKKKRAELENEAKIKYFMDISHDIRSPITLILSPLESLLRQPFDSDVKGKLQLINRNAQRILSLVNQLLDIRKLEKGKMRLSCMLTDLNLFVSELVEMFKPQAEEKGLTLEFSADDNIPHIWVDRNILDKILVNLISNALKFTPKGGNIVVSLTLDASNESETFVDISVIDSGIGLDAKSAGKIFERFYQANDKGGTAKGGFGIGLDLCRRLIEFHHGRISGKNREDGVRGSVFSIMLPVENDCYAEDELVIKTSDDNFIREDIPMVLQSLGAGTEGAARQKVPSVKRKILVVDDDKELTEYICTHLEQRYKVKGVADGSEALREIADNPPDIIVSDVIMPVMDGLTLLRRLKGNAETHHIPVILLSSKNDIADRMSGWDKGADAYIGKPFSVEELEAVIDNMIDNRLRIKGKFSGAQDTEGKISAPEVKGSDELLMERIMKIINRDIDDPKLNVEMLASEVGISRAHLHRKLKEMIGMTPSDFIRSIRIRWACELLQKGSIEVTQVAYTLGFASQSHFSTTFKNFIGMTPSEYRAKSLAGNAPKLPPELDKYKG